MGLLDVYYCITQFNVIVWIENDLNHPSQEQGQDKQRKTWRKAIPTLINEWKKDEEGHVLLLLQPRALSVLLYSNCFGQLFLFPLMQGK